MQRIEIQGCKIELSYLTDEVSHSHQDVEILYVIEHEIQVLEEERYILKANDIVVINSGIRHALSCKKDTIVFRVLIPYRLLGVLSTDEMIFFQCNSALYVSNNYVKLEKLLECLAVRYLNLDRSDLSGLTSTLFQILHELFENFKVDKDKINLFSKRFFGDKADRIMNYISLHYHEPLSLPGIAAHFKLSETYLSRYFKQKTGKNYRDYLNEIRTQNAMQELCQTDHSITNIAIDNGFSTPSVFNRYFKSKYGKTPTAYRNEQLNAGQKKEIGEEKCRELQQQISRKIELERDNNEKIKEIRVNDSESGIKWKNKNVIINIGEAPVILDAEIQKHILLLKEVLGISYVRIWDIFSEKFRIAADFSGESFNYYYLDSVFDFFVKNDVALFLDFGRRNHVIMATNEKELYLETVRHQLRGREEWKNLLNHFMDHLVKRYGKQILKKWIFEFPWNEEAYYEEDYDYVSAYRIGRNAVKLYSEGSGVAGLSPHRGVGEDQLLKAVRQLRDEEIFPDIVTFRIFLDSEHQIMKNIIYKAENDLIYARRLVEKIRNIITDEGIECTYCISEWSNSMSNRNIFQDSCARGTDIINFVSGMSNLADMMGFWHGSDAVDIYYDSQKLICGGGGILTKDGIRKPSFHAFEFLGRLGEDLVKIGDNYIITRDSSGTLICLFYNRREYSYYYYLKNETENKVLSKMFQSEEKIILNLEISDLKKDGSYFIKEEVVNENYGSIQNEWQALGNQEELGKTEIQYLKNICVPKLYMRHFRCMGGRLDFQIEMEPHEMRLIYIYPG